MGAHPASHLWVQAVLSPGKRLLGRKVNHSPLSSAEIQNKWRYTSITPTCVDGVDRENLTFSLISRKENKKNSVHSSQKPQRVSITNSYTLVALHRIISPKTGGREHSLPAGC